MSGNRVQPPRRDPLEMLSPGLVQLRPILGRRRRRHRRLRVRRERVDVLPQGRDDHPGRHRRSRGRQLLAQVVGVDLAQRDDGGCFLHRVPLLGGVRRVAVAGEHAVVAVHERRVGRGGRDVRIHSVRVRLARGVRVAPDASSQRAPGWGDVPVDPEDDVGGEASDPLVEGLVRVRGVRQLPPRALGGELTPLRRRNPERSNLHLPCVGAAGLGNLALHFRGRIVCDDEVVGAAAHDQDRVPGFREAVRLRLRQDTIAAERPVSELEGEEEHPQVPRRLPHRQVRRDVRILQKYPALTQHRIRHGEILQRGACVFSRDFELVLILRLAFYLRFRFFLPD